MTTTLDDLKDAGFVPYQVWAENPKTLLYAVMTIENKYVHKSVADWCRKQGHWQKEHPVVWLHSPKGCVADWGAIQFDVNTWHTLVQFCKIFHYDITSEQLESHL